MVLPVLLMIGVGSLGARERIRKDEKLAAEFTDIKTVLGSLA